MLLDFSTWESSVKTLDLITTIPLYEIKKLADEQEAANDYYSTSWIEDYIDSALFKDYSKIHTTFFHITTVPDLKELKENGLQNLQTVLSTDNFFSDFLRKYDIYFDVPNRELHHGNKITYLKKLRNTDDFYRLFNRIDYDFNVNGFYYFSSSKYSGYSTIDEIPEFLNDTLSRVFSNSATYQEAVEDWKNQTTRFLVKGEVPVSKIEISCVEDFPFTIASKLLTIFLSPSDEMIPKNEDIIYLSRQEFISPKEIKSITKLPKKIDSLYKFL